MAKRKSSLFKTILLLFLMLALSAAVLGCILFYLPYLQAHTAMPRSAALVLQENVDGTIHMQWPEAPGADLYLLEIYAADAATGLLSGSPQSLYSAVMPGQTQCDLPAFSPGTAVTVSVRPAAWYRTPREEKLRLGEPLELTVVLSAPTVSIHSITPVPELRTVTVNYEAIDSSASRLYLKEADGSFRLLSESDSGTFHITFGEDGLLPMPNRTETYTFCIDASREQEGLCFYGYPTVEFTVERKVLLSTRLDLRYTDTGNNSYVLQWNETQGDRYVVQMRTEGSDWQDIGRTDIGTCRYTTGHLSVYTDYSFRVLAVNDDPNAESPYAVVSDELVIETAASPVYATVWPLKDLNVTSEPGGKTVLGTAKAASAYCVLDETDGYFRVLHNGAFGYIDSRYCMINLPEYMGDLCAYDITNSYSAIYMVHEYGIPEVTATVITGYENVRTADGSYLVPLLYPTAQRLVTAADAAREAGYQLLIYDTYRPRMATLDIYNVTKALLDTPIPAQPFAGAPPADLPQLAEGEVLTYRQLMTAGKYSLGQFLANGYSMHNLGVALDLTLLPLSGGTQLQMQTSMHDLSHYSVLDNNNENADLLSSLMLGAGFGGLASEWWHFQDDLLTDALKLDCHLYSGVSCACWVSTGNGWRWRNADGTFAADTVQTIAGTTYHFDAQGYVTDAPWTVKTS